jgi:hypothetical protein
MEVGFKPKTAHRGEITMSITVLMQPMFLSWLHRSNGVVKQGTLFRKGFSALRTATARPCCACEKPSHGHRDLGGRRRVSNILRVVF